MNDASLQSPRTDRHAKDLAVSPAANKLSKRRYTSPEFWRLENERLWPQVWQLACLAVDVAHPGEFFEFETGDQSILIVRTEAGELKAFFNVCLHRGNRIRSGCGRARELQCRYHRWTWALDGTLAAIPDREEFEGLDEAAYRLHECRVEAWGGLVFINMDPQAPSLVDWLGPVAERLAPYRFDEHVCADRRGAPVEANWKTVCDAFLEAYHVQGIHPQLLPGLDDVNTTYELWSRHSAMVMPYAPSPKAPQRTDIERLDALARATGYGVGRMLRDPVVRTQVSDRLTAGDALRDSLSDLVRTHLADRGFPVGDLSASQLLDDHHYFIFPNLVLNIHAGHYTLMRFRPHATAPEAAIFDMFHFRWEPAAERDAYPRKDPLWFAEPAGRFGEIAEQDFENLPTVQKGMRSRALVETTLCRHEQRIMAFHRTVDAFVFGEAAGAGDNDA